MAEYVYDAFISYSHRDMNWARWLQRRLESFRVPKELRAQTCSGGRLRVFRDQTDLAGAELQDALRRELDASRYVIVICSPSSAASRWVDDELRYFRSLGREDRILPFIVDGEPESDDPALECFPTTLRHLDEKQLLGAGVHELGRGKASLKLIAVLLGVRFNRLADREKQRRRRTALISASSALVLTAAITTLLLRNAMVSRENRELSYDIYGAALVSIAQKDEIEPADVAFLRVSAEAGNTNAILLLADCLQNGWGVDPDPEAAFGWFRRAAEEGDVTAMVALANCYRSGSGTEIDLEQSFVWDLRAAEAGEPAGMVNTAICYEDEIGVQQDLTAAFDWYRRAAECDYDLGMYNLARCYRDGIGTEADLDETFYWIERLAALGNTEAMYNLALMYQYGFGVEADLREAYIWYRRAAEAGDADGMYMTAWCTENNCGTENAALEWYRAALEHGCERAAAEIERLEAAGGE